MVFGVGGGDGGAGVRQLVALLMGGDAEGRGWLAIEGRIFGLLGAAGEVTGTIIDRN
jgi:hypothetical protein